MKKSIAIEYDSYESWKELSDQDQVLVEKSFSISKNAYAPYSKFKVGACARLKNGELITGSNQENIAYPSGLCAERVALFYAGAQFPNEEVDTISIVAEGDLVDVDAVLAPCGSCRQVMLETEMRQSTNLRVILVNQNGSCNIFYSVKDLLPLAFGV